MVSVVDKKLIHEVTCMFFQMVLPEAILEIPSCQGSPR